MVEDACKGVLELPDAHKELTNKQEMDLGSIKSLQMKLAWEGGCVVVLHPQKAVLRSTTF